MVDLPTFPVFYRAVHDRDPFPWQARLAVLLASEGWPADIGVPTGLGKTAAIDIAVWALAHDGTRLPTQRLAPRRIWYVVNRRLLVDVALDHAERLAALLADPSDLEPDRAAVLATVADHLRHLLPAGTGGDPLHVSRQRGGAEAGDRPPHPAQPAVICATVPMFASRVLFSGYGSSRAMRPIDAGLAGIDSLVLLDEAHLARPLHRLLGLLEPCDAPNAGVLRAPGLGPHGGGPASLVPASRARPQLVALTATGATGHRFDLDDEDHAHPVVRQRLDATKPTHLRTTTAARLAADLAATAVELLDSHPDRSSAVVFVNRPATARAVARELSAWAGDVIVLTGQLRAPDADRIRAQLLGPDHGIPAGRTVRHDRPLIVVATQTLEVGADVDVDVLVTETAGVRALTQRLGRLNRLGLRPHAAAAIVHPNDRGHDPLYGDEPADVFERLGGSGTIVELSPRRVGDLLGPPADPPPRSPELLPFHLWEWAKTSHDISDAAPVEPFFDGFDDTTRSVSLAWRTHLEPGHELLPVPAAGEFVELPIHDARAFAKGIEATGIEGVLRVTADGISTERVDPDDIRPGDRLIARAIVGGYGNHGFDPELTDTVIDLSPQLRHGLWLTQPAIQNVLGTPIDDDLAELLADAGEISDGDPDPAGAAIAAKVFLRLSERLDWLAAAADPRLDRPFDAGVCYLSWRPAAAEAQPPRVDALDELSIAPTAELADHLIAVGEVAGHIAAALGVPDPVAAAVAQAGRFHDLGKADPRFQHWLGAPAGTLLAKSGADPRRWAADRRRAGWPAGARHELLSVQLLDAHLAAGGHLDDADLVRHLVAAHHGHGRPSIPSSSDGGPLPSRVPFDELLLADTDPTRVDWEQPERFRALCERYGYWGLALLEACVRQADHLVTAATEVL